MNHYIRFEYRRSIGTVRASLLLTLLLVFASLSVRAQVATADVLGTVTDSSGAVLPGAFVKIENLETHEVRTTTSAGDGQYTFTTLQVGTYTVTVLASSFKTFVATQLRLAGGDRTRVDASLVLGATNEQIEVTALASALQTDSTNVGSTISQAAVQDVPLNGRNFMALVQVAPGVNAGSPNSIAGPGRLNDRRLSSAISVNGQDEISNDQMIDGMDNQTRWNENLEIRPSVDAIEQVRTDINLYTAEVGRTVGAAVNVLTKSGTNNFHGTVYEFFRNDITDARNYFATATLLSHKPELRQNQYGGSLGGPIFKDRTFFFMDYEGYRRIDGNASVYISSVPSQFEHDHPGNLTDICGADLSATANATTLGYFKLYPAPTPGLGFQAACVNGVATLPTNNFIYNPTQRQNQQLADAKIDHHFGAHDTLLGRYSYNHVSTLTPPAFPVGADRVQNSGFVAAPAPGNSELGVHQVQLAYTHLFSSSLVMQMQTGFTFYYTNATPFNYGKNLNDTAPYLIPNANECLACSGLATITLTGAYAPMGDPTFQPRIQSEVDHQFAGSLTWTHQNHTIKTGGSLVSRNDSTLQGTYPRGYIQFTGGGLTSLTNFFKGTPYTYNRLTTLIKPYLRSWESSAYVQDDWRVNAKLTLNYGVRYDVYSPANEKYGNLADFKVQNLQMIVGQTAGIHTSYVGVAPRVGFAFTATPTLVVRGGYGMTFYPGDQQTNWFIANPPYQYSTGNVTTTGILSVNGLPAIAPQSTATSALSGSISTKPFNFREEYFHQFNLLVQDEFHGTVLTVGYVGELGRRMQSTLPNIDLPKPSGSATLPALLYAAALPNVNTIQYIGDEGTANYNSLQLSAERRLYKGLTINVNYTFAHGLNNVLNTTDGDTGTGYVPSDSHYDYGNSVLDIRDRVAGTITYALPFGKGRTALYRTLVGGWQVNSLGFWQTGLPIMVAAGAIQSGRAQVNLPTITTDRPNFTGANPYAANKGINQWFNLGAFVKQPIGTAGTEARNQFSGPRLRRADVSVIKNIPIRNELSAQFRVECFNITNTPNFANPATTIGGYSTTTDANGNYDALTSGGFGTITATATGFSGRQVQFAVKVKF